MKLYTEEQVKHIVEKSRETGLTAEYLMLTTPPNEPSLPTISKTEKVQTALVWYAIEETNLTIDYTQGKISQLEYAIKRLDILEQAKQMEARQKIDLTEICKCDSKGQTWVCNCCGRPYIENKNK